MHAQVGRLSGPVARRTWRPAAGADTAIALLTFLVITGVALYAAVPVDLPRPVPATAAPGVFSSGRALTHIRAIAQKPHPMGSPENAAVRDYLVRELAALGLQPQVQKVTAATCCFEGVAAGAPENVLARLRGTAGGKAFLLMAHYDSVPTGPGASDDGAGVAAMLETLRAVKAGPPLKNDVIFLFTDGEERGLLGARAFVGAHPWARDVGLVLNLEARGHTGAARMFQTSASNGWLIGEFAKAAPYPFGNSADAAGYSLSGSDTDLSVFLEAGRAGLNVAYTEGVAHYHTALDTPEALDERSLQHLGSYVLALTRHFGNTSLDQTQAPDAVYFNLLRLVVHYPAAATIPLAACATAVYVAVVAFGFRRRHLTVGGVALGFLAFLASVTVAPLAAALLWTLVRTRYPHDQLWALHYNAAAFWLGFACLTVAVTAALYNGFRVKARTGSLAVGALLWQLLLAVLTSVFSPPASFGATWPLISSLLGLAILFALGGEGARPWPRFAVLTLSAVPAVLIGAPAVYGVTLIRGLFLPPVVPIFTLALVTVLGSLIPHLDLVARPHRWVLPGAAAALGLTLVLAGSLTAGHDVHRPKPNNIAYALNLDTQQAIWFSQDEAPDAWTAQFLGAAAGTGAVTDYLPGLSSPVLRAPAPTSAALVAPDVALIEDGTQGGVRTLRLRITAPPPANLLRVAVDPPERIVGAAVNGERVPDDTGRTGDRRAWTLSYWAPPPEGVELTLHVRDAAPVRLTATAGIPGLPALSGASYRSRPAEMVPYGEEDRTLVSKSFTVAAQP